MGKKYNRLYKIWYSMKERCYNQKNLKFKNYGARGIKICDEWLSDFRKFKEWAINNGYEEHLTIDRIDNDGNYEKTNCRWITNQEQQYNKTYTHYLQYKGKKQSMAEWSLETGIGYKTLAKRINESNWGVEKALTTPVDKNKVNYRYREVA